MRIRTGWQRDCGEISPHNKAHCRKNTVLSDGGCIYWYNVTPKDDASASTAPANLIYSYTARIRGVDVTLPQEDAGPSRYKVGDNVWVKLPHGRCTTQFGKGTITGVYSPHSVLVDGTPRHIKDVRLVRGADATYCSSASSEDEAPMLYLPQGGSRSI